MLGRHDDVLEPQAEAAREVHARLDAERVARFERGLVAGDHIRILVRLDPDAMTGAMHERLAVAGVSQHSARRGIDVLAAGADYGRTHADFLRLDEHGVGVMHLRIYRADCEHSRDIRAVPAHRAAEVAQHDIALSDHAITRLVVRAGRVRPASDDRKVCALVPGVEQPLDQLSMQLTLGSTSERLITHLDRDGVDGAGSRGKRLDLIGMLHGTQRSHHAGSRREPHVRERVLEQEDAARPGLVAHGDGPRSPRVASHELDRVVLLVPRLDPEQLGLLRDSRARRHEARAARDRHRSMRRAS